MSESNTWNLSKVSFLQIVFNNVDFHKNLFHKVVCDVFSLYLLKLASTWEFRLSHWSSVGRGGCG